MSLEFRADLQGLRALSITLVVLAHAGMPGVAGGYVGVDVFFVLSGYLISGLLIGEYRRRRRIRWGAFVARRLRRLLPALLVMLLSVTCLGALFLSTHEFTEQAASIGYAATWTSNLFFAFSTVDYFAELRQQDLFLHTWSLGVEEQFYLVWPLLLAGAFWLWKRALPDTGLHRRLQLLFGFCFVSSLSLSLYWSFSDHQWAFYLMPSRIWEFALGAWVFAVLSTRPVEDPGKARNGSGNLGLGLAVGGAIAVVGSALLLDAHVTYPGYWALIPATGAAMLIAAGAVDRHNKVNALLAHRIPVWIGDRSYSWYLWHWPLLMLGGAYGLRNVPTALGALVALSLMIAAFSYRKVELPFWKGRYSETSPRLTIASASLAMALVATALTQAQLMARDNEERGRQLVRQVHVDMPSLYATPGCDTWYRNAKLNPCVFGNPSGRKTVVLLGDSIGAQWVSALPSIFAEERWRTVVLTKSACAIVDEDYFYDMAGGTYDVCRQWRDNALEYIAEIKPDVVLMGNATSYPFDGQQWIDGTRRILARIAKSSGQIVVVPGTPRLSFDGPGCLERWIRDNDAATAPDRQVCSEPLESAQVSTVANYLNDAVASLPNAAVLDLTDLVCPGGRCSALSGDGDVVFRDHQHLTDSFVRAQVDDLGRRLALLGVTAQRR